MKYELEDVKQNHRTAYLGSEIQRLLNEEQSALDMMIADPSMKELAEEEGSGYNIKQKEYHASAWNGAGPYVASETTGLAIGNIKYRATDAAKYDQTILEYFFKSESGWLEYENVLSTIIATPEASTVTRNALLTILDALTTPLGFDAKLDDAAVASVNPTVIEAQPASAAVDGLD